MIGWPSQTRVYLALGSTDMRKEINGLSVLVEGKLGLDPLVQSPEDYEALLPQRMPPDPSLQSVAQV